MAKGDENGDVSESDGSAGKKGKPKSNASKSAANQRDTPKEALSPTGEALAAAKDTVAEQQNRIKRIAKSATTAKIISSLESHVSTARRERKIGKGTIRDTYVAAYRGFTHHGQAIVRVRVVEQPVVPESAELVTDPKVLSSNLRRFFAISFPGVRLKVMLGDEATEVTTDRHGFATANISSRELEPGWHEYHAITRPDDPDEKPTIGTGETFVPDPAAPFFVVSDIDDTVLRTGLTEGFTAVRNTFMGSPETRRAIPGMAALYQGLLEGVGPKTGANAQPGFFYVSTGPWNLYEMLTEFLEFRGFPKGVMFLTDWGPREQYVMRSGQQHKRLTLNRLFAAYPEKSFVLIGDSGQHDPDVYVEIAREHHDRVTTIVILDVGEHMAERAAELREWTLELAKEGIDLYLADDAIAAAHHLSKLGLVSKSLSKSVSSAIANQTEG